MPWCSPNPKLSPGAVSPSAKTRARCSGNHNGVSLLPRPSYKAMIPPGRWLPGSIGSRLVSGTSSRKKSRGPNARGLIAAHEQIGVPNVIRFESNDCRLGEQSTQRRSLRIQNQGLASGVQRMWTSSEAPSRKLPPKRDLRTAISTSRLPHRAPQPLEATRFSSGMPFT